MAKAGIAKSLVVLVLCGTLIWTSCSTAWINEVEQIVAVLIPATANIVSLVATLRGNVSAADLQIVESAGSQAGTGLQLMRTLLAPDRETTSPPPPRLLQYN